jgi:hypothetical protein
MWVTFLIFKKIFPKKAIAQLGENSPNLVTLNKGEKCIEHEGAFN